MKTKKPLLLSTIIISIFLCLVLLPDIKLLENDNAEPIKTSGAGKAIDQWSFERSYPSQSVNTKSYLSAFEAKRNGIINTQNRMPGTWESLGPENTGGRTLCLAFHPTNPDIIYVGTASGGLWKTTTQGEGRFAWDYVPTGFPVLGVGAVAIDPTNPDIIVIGTGEVYGTGFAEPGTVNRLTRGTYGIGILKSTDGGLTWSQVLNFDNTELKGVQDLVINPQNSQEMYAATTDGVYRSLNGGNSWSLIFSQPNCIDIEIDPNNGDIIYVTQGNFNYDLIPSLSGIFKSTNKGNSFTELIDTNLLSAWSGNAKLSIDPSNSNTLYASIQVGWFNNDATTPGGIFRSTNAGANWSYINNQNIARFQGWYSHDVAVNPNNPSEVINVGIDAWKSIDGAANFIRKSDWTLFPFGEVSVDMPEGGANTSYVHADIHAVYYHPLVANKVFYATDGGVFSSSNGGETFTARNGGLQIAQFYADMSSSSLNPDLCIGGTQDNSTWIYRGSPSWSRNIGGDGMTAIISNDDDQVMFGSAQRLQMLKSTDEGVSWNFNFYPNHPDWIVGDAAAFNAPYELAPSNNDIMYAGATYLYKSVDEGISFTATSTQPVDGTNVITKIAISSSNPDIVFVSTAPDPLAGSTETPKILKSINGGQTFMALSGLPNRFCKDIEIDPSNDNNVYAVFSGFGTSHIYKSTNGGDNWQAIDNGLPDVPTNTILIDPLNPEDLYVGNDLGVYYSEDGGSNWTDFNESLFEATMVYDLNVSPVNRKVRIATHGHGIWQRDFVKDPLSVESIELVSNDFIMYPNPAQARANIEIQLKNDLNEIRIDVYNLLGQYITNIYKGNLVTGKNNFRWDIPESISSGTYILRVVNDEILLSKRLIIN